MTLISVIIPARDDAEFLRACLAALALQTRQADEIVVVDNASSDETAQVARQAGARVVFEPLWGTPAAAAAGFDAAGGDVLARLDADSLPPPDWLERVEAHLDGTDIPTLVTGPGRFYGSGRVTCWLGTHVYIRGYFWSMGVLLGHPPAFGSNFAMHAAVWAGVRARVHRAVRKVHDDLDLSIQLEPGVAIRFDDALLVGISARPFDTIGGLSRRLWWAYLTLRRNNNEEPLRRRRRRWRAQVEGSHA